MAGPSSEDTTRAWRAGVRRISAGIGAAIAVVVVLVLPAVTMLLLPPRGFPTALPDGMALLLLAGAGIVVAGTARSARTWPPFAATLAALLVAVAAWFQTPTWLRFDALPTPPILPNVPPTLVLVAGVFLATAALAMGLIGGGRGSEDQASDAEAGSQHHSRSASPPGTSSRWRGSSMVLGAVAAVAVVTVVEGDVWGRQRLRETFEGPWGLSLFTWLALLFFALLLVGGLLGWLAGSVYARPAATSGAVLLALTTLAIWISTGLDGPPRTTLYGLSLGILVLAAVAPTRRRR